MNSELLSAIRHSFAQSVFTAKCHFKARDRLLKNKNRFSGFSKIISTLTLFILIFQNYFLQTQNKNVISILSMIALLLTGISLAIVMFDKSDGLTQIISRHKKYAEKYNDLRDKYMDLIEKVISNALPDDQARIKKDELQKIYSKLGKNPPETTDNDYVQAQMGLGTVNKGKKTGGEYSWSDEEIDNLLPERLRLSKIMPIQEDNN
jgi:hypothetical protein